MTDGGRHTVRLSSERLEKLEALVEADEAANLSDALRQGIDALPDRREDRERIGDTRVAADGGAQR